MPHTKAEIIEDLQQIQKTLSETVQEMTPEQFTRQPETEWSASDYFKHVILSFKPFVKGLELPKEQLRANFGAPDRPLMNYAELTGKYEDILAQGFGAENYEGVTPVGFRMPEGIQDEKAYLLDTWEKAHQRLYAALENWSETDLDSHQLPHPAINLISIREMLFFTVHHNGVHTSDIQRVGA